MEVHLNGVTVRDHETSAYDVGRFVMRSADSARDLVKAARGNKHHSRNLLVAGVVAEGPADGMLPQLTNLDARACHSVARIAAAPIDGGWMPSGTIRRRSEEVAVQPGPHAARVLSVVSREGYEVK